MGRVLSRALTDEEQTQLAEWQRSGQAVLYRRARIVVLAQTASTATSIAHTLGIDVQTVRALLRRFEHQGLAGVALRPRPGRPRRFAEPESEALIALLHESPTAHGCDGARWTLTDAATALARSVGVASISHETVRHLLRTRRHSWQRAKEWLTSPDPRYAFKKSGATACSSG
jgi:transposase